MNDIQLFIKDGYYCLVKKDDDESYEHFIERGNFIVSQKENNIIEINKIIIYSKIWINYKYMGCCYTPEIMNKLNNYQQNLFTIV